MNNFNRFFQSIKSLSDDDGRLSGTGYLQKLSEKSLIPLTNIQTYLEVLNGAGIIQFCLKEGFIKLTELGKSKDTLFG